MILITGATGNFGSATVDHLLRKGVKPEGIAVLVRDHAKAEKLVNKGVQIREGDYNDYESLVTAFQGTDKLLLVSSNDRGNIENRTAHHLNVIKAAKDAKVEHLIYTSFARKPGFENSAIATFQDSHLKSEACIKDSGLDYTILQNGIYLEMIPIFAGSKVAETNVIMFPAADGKAGWVLRDELAEAAAYVLMTDGHVNKTYTLTNTQSVSFEEIAENLSATLGKEVRYQSPPVNEFEANMKQLGVPDMYIGMFVMWAVAQAQGALDLQDNTLENCLGRKPMTAKQFIKQVYG